MKGKEIYNIGKIHLIVKTSWSSTNMVSIDDKYDLVVYGRRFGFLQQKRFAPILTIKNGSTFYCGVINQSSYILTSMDS